MKACFQRFSVSVISEVHIPTIRLIHWNEAEAEQRAGRLQALGYQVDASLPQPPALLAQLAQQSVAALVIDLSRLPSQGRDLALTVRARKATRNLPLVLIGGEPDKVDRIRELLPDATFCTWEDVGPALDLAIRHPPARPVVPRSSFEAYRDRPLALKLGIKPGSRVGLVNPPDDLKETLSPLPADAVLDRDNLEQCHLLLWFVRSAEELHNDLARIVALAGQGKRPLWIIWPKGGRGAVGDLTQQQVREAGLGAGWVDFKICAVDRTWSGLLFRRRKQGP